MTDDTHQPVREEPAANAPIETSAAENPLDLMKQIEETEGWKIAYRIRLHSISYHVYRGNHGEIRRALQAYHTPAIGGPLWAVTNRPKLELFQREMIRLFHNHVASAKSLMEHTRNFVKQNYSGSEFEKEYLSKVQDTFHNPFCAFVMKLRDFLLHFGLPTTSASFHFGKDIPLEYKLNLDVASLREWDEWKHDAMEYLNTLASELELDVVVNDYNTAVTGFYEWFGKRLQELHSKEFEETSKLQNKLRELTAGDVIS
jgi:hypothetical protein